MWTTIRRWKESDLPSVSESVDVAATPEAAFSFVADAPARPTMFIPGLNRRGSGVPPVEQVLLDVPVERLLHLGHVQCGKCTTSKRPTRLSVSPR